MATLRFLSKTASEGGVLAMRVVGSVLLLESENAAVPDGTLGLKKLSFDSSARRSASSLALSIFSICFLSVFVMTFAILLRLLEGPGGGGGGPFLETVSPESAVAEAVAEGKVGKAPSRICASWLCLSAM
jgi:hypothetical protein